MATSRHHALRQNKPSLFCLSLQNCQKHWVLVSLLDAVMSWVLTVSLVQWGLHVVLSCGREIPRGRRSSEEVFVRSTDTGNSWVSRGSHTLLYHPHYLTPSHPTLNHHITLNSDSSGPTLGKKQRPNFQSEHLSASVKIVWTWRVIQN